LQGMVVNNLDSKVLFIILMNNREIP
jgi:hypothetical protein